VDNICPSDFETDSCLALNCEADLAQKGSQRWWRSPIEGIAMSRRIAITVIVAAFVGLLGFLFLAWRPDILSHATPDRAGSHSPVDTGERPILGPSTGAISRPTRRPGQVWSLAAFTRAMHEGVS
jgi:hypothetical protein